MASISTQHSYIVLRLQEGSFRRGELVELECDGRHNSHTHGRLLRRHPIIRIADSDLAPLDEEQCVILDSIDSDDVRYTVYSTPGLLEWGVGLKVGDTVLAKLTNKNGDGSSGGDQYTTAITRWIGIMDRLIMSGQHYGVEITVSSLLYHHIITSHHNHNFCIRTPYHSIYYFDNSVCVLSDCIGLIPRLPGDEVTTAPAQEFILCLSLGPTLLWTWRH